MTQAATLRLEAVRAATRGRAVFPLHTPTPRGPAACSCGRNDCGGPVPGDPPEWGGKSCGKHPRTADGFKAATQDTATVDAWWEKDPDANIGMATGAPSAVFVVDIDVRPAKPRRAGEAVVAGMDAWAELVAAHGDVKTARTRTGSGGLQLFFELPKGREVRSGSAVVVMPDGRRASIDVKAEGGYVILPPSLHRCGRRYEWIDRIAPTACPGWLLDLVAPLPKPAPTPAPAPRVAVVDEDAPRRRYLLKVLQSACDEIQSAQAGGVSRHQAIYKAARLVGGYLAGEPGLVEVAEAEAALVAAGVAVGKEEREVRRTVADALKQGATQPIQIPERTPPRHVGTEAPVPDDRDAPYVDREPPEIDAPPPLEPDDPGPEVADLLQDALAPKINVSGRQGSAVVADAWRTVIESNRRRPELFRLGGKLARLHRHEGGALIELCLPVHVHGQLMRAIRWMRSRKATLQDGPTKDGWVEVDLEGGPPAFVSADMVASPRRDLPAIETVVYAPTLGRDGDLLLEPGYHASDALWHETERPLRPVRMGVPEARSVLEDWLADFPFARQSDRAHALALFLLPFVRRLIDGPTPVHLLEAPQPGTGKSLLGQVLMRVAHGRDVPLAPWDRDEKERKKTITTYLMAGRAVVFFDNVKGQISSESFENATTSRRWVDRVLGITGDVEVPIFAVWLMTSNNATMSPDMARRTCRIRLVRHTPFDAASARHPDIEAWTDEHRDELVSAALTLIADWLARGRPGCTGTLATYEAWAGVVGGILANAGIEGFLADRAEFLERADPTTAEWTALVEGWLNDCDGAGRSPTDLLQLCDKLGVLQRETEGGSERARVTRLGAALRSRVEASFAGRQLRVRRVAGCPTYYLTREPT